MIVRTIGLLALLAVALVAFLALAPASLGGSNTYVVTRGTSMLPTIKPDSLVVIRAESSYHVGEIVAYHNRDLNAVVLHRIVARDGSKYVFKGDNNQFADLYEANASDLVGAKVFYSASAGRVMIGLRNPLLGATLLGAFVIWVLWDFGAGPSAKTGRRRAPRGKRSPRESRTDSVDNGGRHQPTSTAVQLDELLS